MATLTRSNSKPRIFTLGLLALLLSFGSLISTSSPAVAAEGDFLRKSTIHALPNGDNPTSIAIGPDGRVYVATFSGRIYALTVDQNYNVVSVQTILAIYNTPNFNDDGTPAPGVSGRLALGITFDPQSSPSTPVMYVSHSDPRMGFDYDANALAIDTQSGMITRLTGPGFDNSANRLDVITGLPRSRKNHGTNDIVFGPDGYLYIGQGGNTSLGAPHPLWTDLPEHFLSAAVLRANVRSITSSQYVGNVTSPSQLQPLQGTFEIYATGFRNLYDLIWHSNGNLYGNDNGSNPDQGTTPGPSHGCPNGAELNPSNMPDQFFHITQGMYGGHPNPSRGECILNDGLMYFPTKSPEPAFVPSLHAYDYWAGAVSVNGIAEYPVGEWTGNLISATFSGDRLLRRNVLNANGSVSVSTLNAFGPFNNPVDVAIDGNGAIFVAEYGLSGTPGVSVMVPGASSGNPVSITSVTPSFGSTSGGTQVSISGSGFLTGATVTFGGVAATSVSVSSGTSITATTPAHAAGSVNVVVTNPDGQSAALSSGFTYSAPSSGNSLVRVNSGGGSYTSSGTTWSADSGFSGGNTYVTGNNIAGTSDQTLYRSERYGNHTYTFALDNGSYAVTLKFAEIYWNQPGMRVFDVAINGQLVLDDFDILAHTSPLTALDLTFPTSVSNGTLTIQFTTVTDNAKISAIEITGDDTGGGDMTPPTVVSTNPAAWATDVPVTTTISVTFSEPMNKAATEAAFSISPQPPPGEFSWNSDGTVMTFSPFLAVRAFDYNREYTVSIGTSASDLAGNGLGSTHFWSFTTQQQSGGGDTTPPAVDSTSPESGASNAPVDSAISVTFSEPMAQSVTEAAFSTNPTISGSFAWNQTGTVLTFTPAEALEYDQSYSVTIGTGATDLAGNPLQDTHSWSFETASPVPDPAPELNTVSPASGSTAGGTSVTLSGANFASGAVVTFGGIPATSASVTSGTSITAITPARPAGPVNVVVTNPDGQSATLSAAYTYVAPGSGTSLVRTNSGGGSYTGSGITWAADSGFSGGGTYEVGGSIAGTSDQPLYRTERYGTHSYTFALENGDYAVTLKFAEIYWTQPGSRVFDVAINGQLVLDDFDILAHTSPRTALDLTFSTTVTNGSLTIQFTTVTDNAKISAIEITGDDTGGGDTTPPTVVSTSPTTGATGVSVDSTISVTFSEPMNTAATEAAFSSIPSVNGSFSWNQGSTVMTFTPAAELEHNQTYSVTIGTGATDLAGNPLQVSHSWSFTTEEEVGDITPPTVTSSNPASGAADVAVNTAIAVTFSEPMTQTATEAAFSTNPSIAGSFGWNQSGTTLTFTPASSLEHGQTYTVTISTGATDLAGNPLQAAHTWSFTTSSPEPDPAPSLTSITPSTGSTAGGTSVTLSGANFVSGATVTFGGVAATSVSVSGSTSITATTPAHAAGSVSVVVTNPDGQSGTLPAGFTYSAPAGGTSLVRINSGGGNYTGSGVTWAADSGFSGGNTFVTGSSITGTSDQTLYRSERYGNHTYTFSLDNGSYAVTLKFAEIYWTQPGMRVFDVAINGQLVLDDFDILAHTSPLTALDLTFPTSVSNGSLTIQFTTVTDNAKISAIEITGDDTGGGDTTPPTVVSTNPASGATSVPVNAAISVSFSEPMAQAATEAAFSTNPSVTGSFSWNQSGTILTFTPAAELEHDQTYTVTIGTGATDLAGNPLTAAHSWSFTTASGGDPALGEWVTLPELPAARSEVGVVEAGGVIYVLGGGSPQGLSNSVFAFNAASGTWEQRAPYPGPAVDHAGAASVNGIVYMLGGLTSWPDAAVDTLYAYDPATNTWEARASMPRARGAMGVAVINGKIYAAGGLVNGGQAVGDLTVYDPQTDTWTELAPMPVPRDHLSAEAVNGILYALGGRPVDIYSPVTAHHAYDPATNTWQSRAPLPAARAGHGSGVLNGKIVIFGGEGDSGTPSGTFEHTFEYDPGTDSWRSLAPMITPRHGMNGAVLNNVIYVPGGGPTLGGSHSQTNEAFSFSGSSATMMKTAGSLVFFLLIAGWFEVSQRRKRAS